jgi:sodium-dependent phosphate cotransporter
MYPLTLGANLGTCITALMASLVTEGILGLQVALCHLIFNVMGILFFYVIPITRVPVIYPAKQLGKMTRLWRGFPVLFIGISFFLFPVTLMGLSYLIAAEAMGLKVIGWVLVICLLIGCGYFAVWWYYQDGKQKTLDTFKKREYRRVTMETLPEDMDYVKATLRSLIDHTGLPTEDDEEEQTDKKTLKEDDEDSDEVAA